MYIERAIAHRERRRGNERLKTIDTPPWETFALFSRTLLLVSGSLAWKKAKGGGKSPVAVAAAVSAQGNHVDCNENCD